MFSIITLICTTFNVYFPYLQVYGHFLAVHVPVRYFKVSPTRRPATTAREDRGAAKHQRGHGVLTATPFSDLWSGLQKTRLRGADGSSRCGSVSHRDIQHPQLLHLRALVMRPPSDLLTVGGMATATARARRVRDRALARAARNARGRGQAVPRHSAGLHRGLDHRRLAAHWLLRARRFHPAAGLRRHLARGIRPVAPTQL